MFFISLFAFLFSVGAICGIFAFILGQDQAYADIYKRK